MKTILSLSSFVFFFTLRTHFFPLSCAKQDDCNKFLCDDNWNHVKAGEPYHFGPPTAKGGGIYLGGVGRRSNDFDDDTWPRYGLVSPSGSVGDFFTFTPINPNDAGLVPLETAFAIASAENSSCNNSTGILRMTRKDKRYNFWHVRADGIFNTSSSCFQFVNPPVPTVTPYTPMYLLQNCPYKCGRGTGECYQVGNRTVDNGGYDLDYFLSTENYAYHMVFELRSAYPEDLSASV